MNKTLRALLAKKAAKVQSMRALSDKAAGEDRDFTDAEATEFAGYQADIATLNAQIQREEALVAEETGIAAAGSLATTRTGTARAVIEVLDNREDDPRHGFGSFAQFAMAVRSAAMPGGARDERLQIGAAAPATFGNESAGADGGFAVPPEFSRSIWTHSLERNSLLPMTDNTPVSGNSMVFPKDETTPWGTDGVRAYWQAEATAGTPTKPKLSTSTLRLLKLMALVPLTDELMQDTNALDAYLPKKVGDSIRWKTNEAILWGSGNGTPLGAFNGNCVVTVAKESGQAANTLQALNLAKMIATLPEGSYENAVWMVNNDVLPVLFTLTLSNYPIYLPVNASQGGIQGSPYGMLLGRPVMISQHAKSLSSQGDVLLLDPTYYRTITKSGGVETATSIHLYFDADVTAFRTTFRIDGQPKIVNPIAPANGSNNLSPFVQLGAR